MLTKREEELRTHINALQTRILANEAYRSHPTKYRPFGCQFDFND